MDIREILQSLDEKDRKLWSECRTSMRKTYLNAHNKAYGIANWEAEDDAFMDLIDIKLAILFDRAGRIVTNKQIIGDNDVSQIENDLNKQASEIKAIGQKAVFDSSKLPVNEWFSASQINKE